VAKLTEQQRETNRARRWKRADRKTGTRLAQDHAWEALNGLAVSTAPEGLTSMGAHFYKAEAERLRDRIGKLSQEELYRRGCT